MNSTGDPKRRNRHTEALRSLLALLLDRSAFYRRKLRRLDLEPNSFELEDLPGLPFTTKPELVADHEETPPYGSGLTEPLEHYVRLHKTSGTTGRPLRWLDTAANWAGFLDCWRRVLHAAGVTQDDRILVAFSFGPFIGFWGAFEAAQQLGALTVSGGAQTSRQRLQTVFDEGITVLISTPTYALHLAEVARAEGRDLRSSPVRRLIQAGEPGASVPSTRARLVSSWAAEVYDHAGATELGAWGYPSDHEGTEPTDMCVNEDHFLPELIEPTTEAPIPLVAGKAARGELVLTSLTRLGSPLLRYRTGDLVDMLPPDASCPVHRLRGGVLGRADDMFVIRGVNVFPSAVQEVAFSVPGLAEFQADVTRRQGLSELEITVEAADGSDPHHVARQLEGALREQFSMRVPVRLAVEPLPRFELKARRFSFRDGD